MDDVNGCEKGFKPKDVEEACTKVGRLYNTGTNCDKAVLLVLQEVWGLPEYWNLDSFYSDKPEGAERFLCKVVAAGAVSIYLDVLNRRGISREAGASVERVIHLCNTCLEETTGEQAVHPARFDPFAKDSGLDGDSVGDDVRQAYFQRAGRFFEAFEERFGRYHCQEILGFDPFRYAEYDEEMQNYIEEGEWMKKCTSCMDFIIRTVYDQSTL